MKYRAVILDSLTYIPEQAKSLLNKLAKYGRLIFLDNSQYSAMFKGAIVVKSPGTMIAVIDKNINPDILLKPVSENILFLTGPNDRVLQHYQN